MRTVVSSLGLVLVLLVTAQTLVVSAQTAKKPAMTPVYLSPADAQSLYQTSDIPSLSTLNSTSPVIEGQTPKPIEFFPSTVVPVAKAGSEPDVNVEDFPMPPVWVVSVPLD